MEKERKMHITWVSISIPKEKGEKKKSFNNILDKTFIKKKKISITEVAKISSSAFKEKN